MKIIPTLVFGGLLLFGIVSLGLATALRASGERRTILVQWVSGERLIGNPERVLPPGPTAIAGTGPEGSRFGDVRGRSGVLPWRAVVPIYAAAQLGGVGIAAVGLAGLAISRRLRRLDLIESGVSPD